MKVKEFTKEELELVYNRHLCADFPPEELKPLPVMHRLWAQGCYHPCGVVDDAGELLGYAFLWDSEGYVLLDHLGVLQTRRNDGLGSKMLRLLQQTCAKRDGIIMEAEAPGGGVEDVIRNRRLNFYRRNGCRFLPHDAWVFGMHFRVLLLDTSGRDTNEAALAAHQKLYQNYLTAQQMQELVRVPFDPAGKAPPPIDWDKLKRSI